MKLKSTRFILCRFRRLLIFLVWIIYSASVLIVSFNVSIGLSDTYNNIIQTILPLIVGAFCAYLIGKKHFLIVLTASLLISSIACSVVYATYYDDDLNRVTVLKFANIFYQPVFLLNTLIHTILIGCGWLLTQKFIGENASEGKYKIPIGHEKHQQNLTEGRTGRIRAYIDTINPILVFIAAIFTALMSYLSKSQ